MSIKYRIKVTYCTGDSFHTESGKETILEESYSTLEQATEMLNRIKEHYQFVTVVDKYNRGWFFGDNKKKQKMEEVIEAAKKAPWYVEDRHGMNTSIKLLLDNGSVWQIHTFWYDGTFDFLEGVEIITELPKFKVK